MNDDQKSVTIAFALVLFGLSTRHHWPSRLTTWLGKAPDLASSAPVKNLVPVGNLNDWQAALIAYGALLLAADTAAAPAASALAWAVGLVSLFASTGELTKEYPTVFSGGSQGLSWWEQNAIAQPPTGTGPGSISTSNPPLGGPNLGTA